MALSPSLGHCGSVALVGQPNVGKSTLLNQVLGQKLSITSRKPQTTRHQILGIKTRGRSQAVFIDTPGMRVKACSALDWYLNQQAAAALAGADLIVFIIEALSWREADESILRQLDGVAAPVVLLINKVDRVDDKQRLLPFMARVSNYRAYTEVVPLSARKRTDMVRFEDCVFRQLPLAERWFSNNQITNCSDRFLAGEIVREKLMRLLGQEIPYRLGVVVEEYKKTRESVNVIATVWVETKGQKGIVIGNRGTLIKQVGVAARRDLERLLGRRVYLQTWVKVANKCSEDIFLARQLGSTAATPNWSGSDLWQAGKSAARLNRCA